MFEKLVYRESTHKSYFDAGIIAEALVFYEKVIIIGGQGCIEQLFSKIPPFIALEMMREGMLEIHYREQVRGVMNEESKFSVVEISTDRFKIDTALPQLFLKHAGSGSQSKFAARKFLDMAHLYEVEYFADNPFLQDLKDPVWLKKAAKTVISAYAPGSNLSTFEFCAHVQGTQFTIETNLNQAEVTKFAHANGFFPDSSITPEYVVATLLGAFDELNTSAKLGGEVMADSLTSALHQLRLERTYKPYASAGILEFNKVVLGDAKAIRDAVNHGRVSFADVLKIVGKGRKFRAWLQSDVIDEEILREYYAKLSEKNWLDKLPNKAARFVIFQGAGAIFDGVGSLGLGGITAAAVNLADSFFIDKLLQGWKPNQYVDRDLSPIFGINSCAEIVQEYPDLPPPLS